MTVKKHRACSFVVLTSLNLPGFLFGCFCCLLLAPSIVSAQDETPQVVSVGVDELHGIAEVSPGLLLSAHSNGILRTADSGVTWTVKNFPQECTMQDVQFYGGVAILASACNLWRSLDSGKSWDHVYFGGYMGMDLSAVNIRSIAFVGPHTIVAVGAIGAVLRSADAGITWEKLERFSGFYLQDVDFYDTSQGLIVTNSGNVHQSSDGGKTWKEADCTFRGFNLSLTPPYLSGVSYVSRNTCVAVSLEGYVFRSTDNGINWERSWNDPCGNSLEDVEFIDDRRGVAVGNGGTLLYTVDGGLTWDWETYDRGIYFRRVHFVNEREIIAVGDGGVIVRKRFDR